MKLYAPEMNSNRWFNRNWSEYDVLAFGLISRFYTSLEAKKVCAHGIIIIIIIFFTTNSSSWPRGFIQHGSFFLNSWTCSWGQPFWNPHLCQAPSHAGCVTAASKMHAWVPTLWESYLRSVMRTTGEYSVKCRWPHPLLVADTKKQLEELFITEGHL